MNYFLLFNLTWIFSNYILFSGHLYLLRLREMGTKKKGGIYLRIQILRRPGLELNRVQDERAGTGYFSVYVFHPPNSFLPDKPSYQCRTCCRAILLNTMLVLNRACANAAQLFAGTILQMLVSVMMMMRHNLVLQHFIFHTHSHTHT